MRNLLFALFILPLSAYSQVKGDTKIIIKLTDTTNVFNLLVAQVYKLDYTPRFKDDSGRMIVTEKKQLTNINASIAIRALVVDNELILSGTSYLPHEQTGSPIQFRGHKNSVNMQGWEALKKIAAKFPGEILYTK